MNHWYMLTVVGEDRHGIVAHLTHALYEGGCNLGETSMMRLGGNFSIMMMVQTTLTRHALDNLIEPVVDSLGLHAHVDKIKGQLHQHVIPDVRIHVNGADRAGIISQVVGALTEAGLDITDLESDVGGTEEQPIYVMTIEGHATEGIDGLRSALAVVTQNGIDASIDPIDTMLG